ncbi:cyclic nucleotide-binding domain-containing protein [Pseudomonas sp. NPDC087612]|uniref:cyclic nucleotide-binding domain-containing protein n=1 Tax=Pseudomonas sp. NPDC087612 TaxID=3364441 RepID=UPI0038256374
MKIKKGCALFHANDPLHFLYTVSAGTFKTCLSDNEGRERVTNFFMPSDMIGLDAISTERHTCSAFALEDSVVFPISYYRWILLPGDFPTIKQSLTQLLSREIIHDHEMLLMLCSLNADGRLANFLVSLSSRFVKRGYSANKFVLSMSRRDIGSYLGLRLETICRSINSLRTLNIVKFTGRSVEIVDMLALKAVEQGCEKRNKRWSIGHCF